MVDVEVQRKQRSASAGEYSSEHHSDDAADEAKEGEVLRIDARRRVDLQRVVVRARVLEQAIVRVHELVRQPVEPLAARAFAFAFKQRVQ